jgi:heat shock protein HslJ
LSSGFQQDRIGSGGLQAKGEILTRAIMSAMRNIILVIATCALASCNDRFTDPSDAPGEPASDVAGIQGSWDLKSIQSADDTIAVVDEPGRYTAQFATFGRLSVQADCNRCSSAYSTSGTALSVGVLACTRAYCGDTSRHDEYVSALYRATSFERTGSGLVVRHAGGALHFEPLR